MLFANDPWRDFDRMMGRVLSGGGRSGHVPIQAVRRGDEIRICFDLPGVRPDDVELTIDRNMLTVEATRTPVAAEDDEVLLDEQTTTTFRRQVSLSDTFDASKAEASFEHGVLTVRIPLAEQARPRRIPVGHGDRGARTIEANETSSVAGSGTSHLTGSDQASAEPTGPSTRAEAGA